MSDAKKLRKAAADQLGCEPSDITLLEVAQSPTDEFNQGGTTTWIELQDGAGNLTEVLLEGLFGLDTPYVVPGPDGGRRSGVLCGSAEFAKLNALYGREEAHRIIQHNPEYPGSAEDRDEDEAFRQKLGTRIRRNADRMMLAEAENTAAGDKRLLKTLQPA